MQDPVIIDEAGAKPTEQFIAEAQAAKDAELAATLKRKRASKAVLADVKTAEDAVFTINGAEFDHIDESGVPVDKDGFPLELTEVPDAEPIVRQPMNRAERRAQVKQYAAILALTERQRPIVNPTIIPKADRRRRKGTRRAH